MKKPLIERFQKLAGIKSLHPLQELQIKKVIDQSMNNEDIGKLQDVIRSNDLGKVLNTIAVIVDQTGGMPDGAAQMIADLVPEIMPDEVMPDETTPDEDKPKYHQFGLTGDQSNFGGNNPNY